MKGLTVFTTALLFMVCATGYGQELVATGNVTLRAHPPQGIFLRSGKQLSVIKEGDKVKVLEKKYVFFDEWLRVQKGGEVGWVYNGTHEGKPYLIKPGDKNKFKKEKRDGQ